MKAVAFRGTLLLSALLVGIAYALECYSSKDRPVDSKDLLASIQCAENETYCVANITGVEGVRQCKDGGRQKNKQRPRRKPHQLYTKTANISQYCAANCKAHTDSLHLIMCCKKNLCNKVTPLRGGRPR
ncbi:secreted Ly-6/uPAR-related protein 1-like isoform X1 [Pleurodeles waltl]|uniref:secreted Ly-6/uPAR-related protein 1-like isoform X1 n=1 Tax=Pleurodeles waltl TaxID=8319 RepID=UPI0037093B4B